MVRCKANPCQFKLMSVSVQSSNLFQVSIASLDDLAAQTDISYSVVKGSDTETYFKHMHNIEERFYDNWKEMSLGSTAQTPSEQDSSSQYAVWDYPLGDKFTIIWKNMLKTGLLNSTEEGVEKVPYEYLVLCLEDDY